MPLAALLLALLFAPVAAAHDYDQAPMVELAHAGGVDAAHAIMDIRAPPMTVWTLLADCAYARRLMRELLSCTVLEQGEGWQVREHRVRGWLFRPVLRNVARVNLEPNRRLTFHRVAGDWSRSDGEWLLTPIDGGRGTRVEYSVNAAIDGGLPASLTRSVLLRRVQGTLAALRREAEARR
jgi:uncharacterized protein YndB with AHSA1/START domain